MKYLVMLLATFTLSAKANALDFVSCGGKVTLTKGNVSKTFVSSVKISPFQDNGGIAGQVKWKAEVSTPDGKYEVKPIASGYRISQQTLDFNYTGADGSLDLAVGIAKSERIGVDHRGDLGLEVSDAGSTISIVGLAMKCVLSKAFVD